MRRLIELGVLVVAAAAMPAVATPTPRTIDYTISGTFSGSLDGVGFVDTALTFTGVGNTGTFFDFGEFTEVPVALRVSNPFGAGTLAVTDLEAFGVNRDGGDAFFNTIDGSGNPQYNFPVVVVNDAFGAYSGISVVGPTAVGFDFGEPAPTSGGALSLTSGTDITFSATAVAEPAVWGLMIAGFGLVGVGQRGRRTGVVAA